MVREKAPKLERLGVVMCEIKKALVCALDMIQYSAPESEKLMATAWAMKKTLAWANETVRD